MDLILPQVEAYVAAHGPDEPELLARLARETRREHPSHGMMVGPAVGAFLRLLVRLCAARRVLEIGTFTGYSALWMAEGLPDGGSIITCDRDPVSTAMARRYWSESPHGGRIELILADARRTVVDLAGPFDLVLIDGDKEDYVHYWDAIVPKVRPGGLLVADNVLWYGRIFEPREPSDFGVLDFNLHVKADARVEAVMLTVRDGLTVARKRH